MNSKDGVPRKAILVMTAILVSVILGAQASTRATHPVLGPPTPLAPLSLTLPHDTALAQSSRSVSKGGPIITKTTPNVVRRAVTNGQLYAVINNRVVHASGELANSATWTKDKTYYVDNLTIPSGVTLTIESGTTIKVEGSNGLIVAGGTLITAGNQDSPVIITNSSQPLGGPGDYGTAVEVHSGTARLSGILISNATVGVAVDGGTAIVQGVIGNTVSYGVTACDWSDISCAVDASRVTMVGSLGGSACGKVLLGDSLFTPNCDGTTDPLQNLDASIAQYIQALVPRNDACASGDSASCDSVNTALTCTANALHTSSGIAFVVPDVTSLEDVLLFSSRARSSAGGYAVSQMADDTTAPLISGLLTNMVDAFGQLKTTYDSCIPS